MVQIAILSDLPWGALCWPFPRSTTAQLTKRTWPEAAEKLITGEVRGPGIWMKTRKNDATWMKNDEHMDESWLTYGFDGELIMMIGMNTPSRACWQHFETMCRQDFSAAEAWKLPDAHFSEKWRERSLWRNSRFLPSKIIQGSCWFSECFTQTISGDIEFRCPIPSQ